MGLLSQQNFCCMLESQWVEVETVTSVEIGRDRLWIVVDDNRLVT